MALGEWMEEGAGQRVGGGEWPGDLERWQVALHRRMGQSIGDPPVARTDARQTGLGACRISRRQRPHDARRVHPRRRPRWRGAGADVTRRAMEPEDDEVSGADSLSLWRRVQLRNRGHPGGQGDLGRRRPRRSNRGVPGDAAAVAVDGARGAAAVMTEHSIIAARDRYFGVSFSSFPPAPSVRAYTAPS